MTTSQLVRHFRRHPLTLQQSVRLAYLLAFPNCGTPLHRDPRLEALGLIALNGDGAPGPTELARALSQTADFPDAITHHGFGPYCRRCHGSGLKDEASRRLQQCSQCLGIGIDLAPTGRSPQSR